MKFEVGKTYVTDNDAKMKLICIAPEAEPCSRLVFLNAEGEVCLRRLDGKFGKGDFSRIDVIAEYKEPPKPATVKAWAIIDATGRILSHLLYSRPTDPLIRPNEYAVELTGTYTPKE